MRIPEGPVYAPAVSFRTIDELEEALRGADYLPDRGLATALFLSLALEKPAPLGASHTWLPAVR